jgi:hypothetical protein
MSETRRANYALVPILEHLGPSAERLDVPWAEFAGDRTSEYDFTVPTAEATEAYIELQAYEVGTFGHEIHVNGEPLTGFDIPPAEGWQYWMDAVTGSTLNEGENTIRIERDTETRDAFAVGVVIVNWKEPAE